MSTAKTKRMMRRRQKGPLQRRNARRDVTGGTPAGQGRSPSTPAAPKRSAPSRRLSTPAMTRRQGAPRPDQAPTGRARANATPTNPSAPLQVRQRATLKPQDASRKPPPPAQPTRGRGAKRDFATGRMLFPVESGGKSQYLPIENEATPQEKRLGLFVANDSVRNPAANKRLDPATVKRPSVQEASTGRTLFATESPEGTRVYLPKESEATAAELSQGQYVPNALVEVPPKGNTVLDKPPLFEFSGQRHLFATQSSDGTFEYLPKQSQANALELSQGHYVEDRAISAKAPLGVENALGNLPPRYDIGRGRKVYAVKAKEGDLYLPRESEATGLERAQGRFIPDEAVDQHERQRRRPGRQDNAAAQAQRRAQRAARLHPAGPPQRQSAPRSEPVPKASDGTPLWDGFSPPSVSDEKQRQTLAKLHPKYDLGKSRLLYPTETAQGKLAYLPLLADANPQERLLGLYAALVPPEPLEDFLAQAEAQTQIARQTFATARGDVRAFAQADIHTLFEQAPALVLRSAQLVSNSAQAIPQLQQQFKGV